MAQLEAEAIGARIRLARKERGMTQEQLAEIAPFSKRSLQDYEAGVTIPYSHLRDLSRLLAKPEEWFLYGDPDAPSDQGELADLVAQLARLVALLEEERGAAPGG